MNVTYCQKEKKMKLLWILTSGIVWHVNINEAFTGFRDTATTRRIHCRLRFQVIGARAKDRGTAGLGATAVVRINRIGNIFGDGFSITDRQAVKVIGQTIVEGTERSRIVHQWQIIVYAVRLDASTLADILFSSGPSCPKEARVTGLSVKHHRRPSGGILEQVVRSSTTVKRLINNNKPVTAIRVQLYCHYHRTFWSHRPSM